jgi:Ser/Thr protein kinase RdoA (MazF antagonist)
MGNISIPGQVLGAFALSRDEFEVEQIGSGHIHHTYKLKGSHSSYILQRVNKNVFKKPDVIASNLRIASSFLKKNSPDFLFLTPIPTESGKEMVYDSEGFPWRLFPYFNDTFTIDKVSDATQAFDAAAEFARLTNKLARVDVQLFEPTIDRFHDLQWRWEQFQDALTSATPERLSTAQNAVDAATSFEFLVNEYNELISSAILKPMITHNDTKINNVLFSAATGKTICAIDLDTLMPGYFIYDIGDMIRTFVSPVDEEEKDLTKITVRQNILQAVIDGYLSEMGQTLSGEEKKAIPFAGMMMTYIMALRMLTDFLNGDVYYQIKYPGHNLVRAENQFALLNLLRQEFKNQR